MRRSALVAFALGACRLGFEQPTPPDPSHGRDAATLGDVAISPGIPPGDAGLCLAPECTAAGGSCAGGVCELVATSENPISCPSGMPCRLVCNGYRFCRAGATCGGATWCEVQCVGYRACENGVDCAGAQCLVTCNGEEACRAGITASSTCTSHCCGVGSCQTGVGACTVDSVCN